MRYIIIILGFILAVNINTFAVCSFNEDDPHMPVELIYFNAELQNSTVVLHWATATELINYGWNIERAVDTNFTNYEVLGFVEGHGTSYNTWYYLFTDTTLTSNGHYYYRLHQLDLDGGSKYSDIVGIVVTDVKDEIIEKLNFELDQNYPNPFNGQTNISFSLNETEEITLEIYDLSGKKIYELLNKTLSEGKYSIKFDSNNLSSGIYFYKLSNLRNSISKKMILIK